MSNQLCIVCGKNPPYERNGRVFKLCSECALERLDTLLFMPQTLEDANQIIEEAGIDIIAFGEKVKQVIEKYHKPCGFCHGRGFVGGKIRERSECPFCRGTGKVMPEYE